MKFYDEPIPPAVHRIDRLLHHRVVSAPTDAEQNFWLDLVRRAKQAIASTPIEMVAIVATEIEDQLAWAR